MVSSYWPFVTSLALFFAGMLAKPARTLLLAAGLLMLFFALAVNFGVI